MVAGHLKHLLIVRSSVEYLLETRLGSSKEMPDVSHVLTLLDEISEKVARLRKIVLAVSDTNIIG